MRIIKRTSCRFTLFAIGLTLVNTANAEVFSLTSEPSKCISLSEGLVCYQRIKMQWTAPEIGDYCIIQVASDRTLSCWEHHQQGLYEFEFSEKQSEVYELRRQGDAKGLASTRIEVKWVYKTKYRDRLRWKVF